MTYGHDRIVVGLRVNGNQCQVEVAIRTTLADAIRNSLRLTGTHLGCEQGACGSCTVLLDGLPVRSCLVFAFQADGHDVTTVEGLGDDGDLHPLQREFLKERALQCGFCTPGFLMTIASIDHPVSRAGLRTYLSGHICRCTGYEPIVRAAESYLRDHRLLIEEEGESS